MERKRGPNLVGLPFNGTSGGASTAQGPLDHGRIKWTESISFVFICRGKTHCTSHITATADTLLIVYKTQCSI